MIKLRDLKLSRLGTEKGVVALRLAKTKQVKQKVIKSEPTEGERKLRNMLEKPLDKRMVNTSDLLVKVQKYASQNDLTFQQINALTQIQILNNPTISDLVGISDNVITYLE